VDHAGKDLLLALVGRVLEALEEGDDLVNGELGRVDLLEVEVCFLLDLGGERGLHSRLARIGKGG